MKIPKVWKRVRETLFVSDDKSVSPRIDEYFWAFPELKTANLISAYADNEIYCRELRICLSPRDWCEFSGQEFFQDLIEYLHRKEIRGNIGSLDRVPDLEET